MSEDRLNEIRTRARQTVITFEGMFGIRPAAHEDIEWLLAAVERLREKCLRQGDEIAALKEHSHSDSITPRFEPCELVQVDSITPRDLFAAVYMLGCVVRGTDLESHTLCEWAYNMAGAMMAARARAEEGGSEDG